MKKRATVFTMAGAMVQIPCDTVEQHLSSNDGQSIHIFNENKECIAGFFNIQGYYINDNTE